MSFFAHNYDPWTKESMKSYKTIDLWGELAKITGTTRVMCAPPPIKDGEQPFFYDKDLAKRVTGIKELEWYLLAYKGSEEQVRKTRIGMVNGRVWFGIIATSAQELRDLRAIIDNLGNERKMAVLNFPDLESVTIDDVSWLKLVVISRKSGAAPSSIDHIRELCGDSIAVEISEYPQRRNDV